MVAVRIKKLDLFKCISAIDGEYLVIDDDRICKTLREARPKRPRGGGGRQPHLEKTYMPPAKRRCSPPNPPRELKPATVKANVGTSISAARPIVNPEAKSDQELECIVKAVLLEKKKNSKENTNPLDEIFSLD